MAHGNMVSETRGGDTPGSGPRAGPRYFFASHAGPRGTWNPVTCLFSLIARCGRGSFQLSVLVSHGVSSRGARPDTPVPGPYKRRAESK